MKKDRINFASLNSDCLDFTRLLEYIYGLNSFESTLSCFLSKNNDYYCVKSLAGTFGKDRAYIQRSLNNLLKIELITRKKVTNLEFLQYCRSDEDSDNSQIISTGYRYLYKFLDHDLFKEKISADFKNSVTIIEEVINSL